VSAPARRRLAAGAAYASLLPGRPVAARGWPHPVFPKAGVRGACVRPPVVRMVCVPSVSLGVAHKMGRSIHRWSAANLIFTCKLPAKYRGDPMNLPHSLGSGEGSASLTPVTCTPPHRYAYCSTKCTETRYICSAHITPACDRVLASMLIRLPRPTVTHNLGVPRYPFQFPRSWRLRGCEPMH
jgi:hypothetical protein